MNICSPRLHHLGCQSPQILSVDSGGRGSPPELPSSEYLKWALKLMQKPWKRSFLTQHWKLGGFTGYSDAL